MLSYPVMLGIRIGIGDAGAVSHQQGDALLPGNAGFRYCHESSVCLAHTGLQRSRCRGQCHCTSEVIQPVLSDSDASMALAATSTGDAWATPYCQFAGA